MFNNNHIISHNINIRHIHTQHMGGWLSPYCYVGQYASMSIKSLIYLSRGNYTAFDSVYCDTQLLVFRFSFLCIT